MRFEGKTVWASRVNTSVKLMLYTKSSSPSHNEVGKNIKATIEKETTTN